MLSCTIQGNPVPIIAGSFNASYTVNNRPTGSVRVYYTGSTIPGDEGDEIVITRTDDSTKVFAGKIQTVTVAVDEVGNKFATFRLGGYEVIADRRLVGEVYFNRTAGYIVADIITKYLAGDGITAGTIEDGAVIPRAVFGYQTASDVLRALAEANGFIWFIDRDKALQFIERDAVVASVDIDEATAGKRGIRGLSLDKSLAQYRNRQIIQYQELTSVRTETFAGDGETKTWSVEFPIALKPVVNVNNVAKTVGISGLDPDGSNDFYWSKGAASVAQDFFAVPLSDNGAVDRIEDEVEVPFLGTIDASGTHAIATHHDPSTGNKGVVLMRITPTSLDKVFELPIVTDENSIGVDASWINVDYVIIQYYTLATNQYTQEVYRREGDVLIDTTASMNEDAVFSGMRSNGRNIVGIKATFNDYDLLLWTYNASANTITQTDTVAYDTAYGIPTFAIDGQYVVFSKTHIASPFTNPTRIGLLKINSSADTWTLVDEIDITGSDTYVQQRCAIIGTYAFFLANVGIISKVIRIYRINTTTDEFEFVSTYQLPSTYNSYSVDYINVFGSTIVLGGAFVDGDLIILRFDFTTETLSVNGAYEDDINGVISISQAGYGVYDRVAIGDNFVRAFRFSPDVLSVTYQGTFPNVTEVNDFTEQAARIAAEGGTGLYEAFQSAPNTESEPNAIDVAQAILGRYGRIPRAVSFETEIGAFSDGEILTINWPSLGITNEDFLIERIGVRDDRATTLWYSLRCISGRDIGNWQEFWRSLRPASSFDFGGSDTLPKSAAVSDMIGLEDEVTTASADTETNWDEGNWDEMEWQ